MLSGQVLEMSRICPSSPVRVAILASPGGSLSSTESEGERPGLRAADLFPATLATARPISKTAPRAKKIKRQGFSSKYRGEGRCTRAAAFVPGNERVTGPQAWICTHHGPWIALCHLRS
jgi:hypothetical protein